MPKQTTRAGAANFQTRGERRARPGGCSTCTWVMSRSAPGPPTPASRPLYPVQRDRPGASTSPSPPSTHVLYKPAFPLVPTHTHTQKAHAHAHAHAHANAHSHSLSLCSTISSRARGAKCDCAAFDTRSPAARSAPTERGQAAFENFPRSRCATHSHCLMHAPTLTG